MEPNDSKFLQTFKELNSKGKLWGPDYVAGRPDAEVIKLIQEAKDKLVPYRNAEFASENLKGAAQSLIIAVEALLQAKKAPDSDKAEFVAAITVNDVAAQINKEFVR